MSLTIFDNKPTIGTTDEDFRLDITYPSRVNKVVYTDSFAVTVKSGEEMRPDILSSNFFVDVNFYDMILKRNSISNPFSIDAGDVFFSPALNELRENNSAPGKQAQQTQNLRDQYTNTDKKTLYDSRLSLVEAQRLEAMKNKALNAGTGNQGNLLPPNIANIGDREITVKGGKIYFGKDVVNGKAACDEPLSKSEFLARLIKTRNA